ncbi:MAG TPA: hypothetical protein VHB02_11620 [Acidimicrobiales bacterium]|nr:hypothetical protein [Acidimicrobiales bacterium]
MGHRARVVNLPVRIAAGAFILNAGVGKLKAGDDTAAAVHGTAKGTYPFLESVPAGQFVKALGASEVALGGTLLFPAVGDGLAGLSLTAFACGLLGLYLKTPGMRVEGSLRPTQQGTAVAKDVWLLGIGLSLMASAATASGRRAAKGRRARKERRAQVAAS